MPRVASLAAAAAALLASPAAMACPQCAGRADGGIGQALAIGAFVTFPFAIVAVVVRVVKRSEEASSSNPGAIRTGGRSSGPQ